MISFFRKFFSSRIGAVVAILFVGLIGFAFALADINAPGGMFSGGQGETIATVGDYSLDSETLTDTANRAVQQAREEQPGVDMAAFLEADGLDDAIEQHGRALALRGFAQDNGLLIGKRLIDTAIASSPAFQGLSGQFDEAAFRQALAQQNVTEEQVREQFINQELATLVLGPVMDGTRVPMMVARPFAGLFVQIRRGQIAAVPSQAMPQGNPPTSAELNAYYQDNLTHYTLPERRAVRYAVFSRNQLTVPEPTDAQIQEYYTTNSDEYGSRQTRTLRQIILPQEDQAQAFYRQVRGGTAFSEAASARGFSESATRIADATQESFAGRASAAISATAFSASRGDVLAPARSTLGWHVVQVEAVDARGATPLATVRGDIVAVLGEQLAIQALDTFYREIQDAIDNGASFEEVVEAKNLMIISTPLLAPNGRVPDRPSFIPSAELPFILQAANTMEEEDDPLLAEIEPNQRFALVDLTRIARSGPQPLTQIREIATQDFIRERASNRARRVANGIAERVNGGSSLVEALAAADATLPPPQRAQASGAQVAELGENVPAPLQLLFNMAENTAKLIRLPQNQGWFVVVLETIEANLDALTDEIVAQTQRQLAAATANEYAEQFINAVIEEYPIERDEEAITALGNQLAGRDN